MKKLFLSIVTTLLLFSPSFAANVEILPTMQSKTNVQDRVWVGTFQIVWNDFIDKIAHTIVKFPDGTPVMVNELNKQEFTVDELSDKSYYIYVGKVQKNTKKIIVKTVKNMKLAVINVLNNFSATSGGFSFKLGINFVKTATVALWKGPPIPPKRITARAGIWYA